MASSTLWAQTQTGTIHGKITDAAGAPLPFITVVLKNTAYGTVSNFEGIYKLKNIEPGKYILSVSGMGKVPETKEIQLNPNQNLQLDFVLEESIMAMQEIVLTGLNKTNSLRQSAKAVTVLETQEAKLQTASLGEVLSQLSGVNVRQAGGLGSEARFSLNGLTNDQIRFMLNGIPLKFMGYSAGIANVPVNLVDRVEIYKGVVPIAFGADALGGAVNLVSSGNTLSPGGSFSYQTGSFGTHRLAINGETNLNNKGLFILGSAYYDYAENNYEVDVEVPNESGKLREVTVPRFHDSYKAAGLRATIGVQNRKWADELSLEVFGNSYHKDIQNNNIMSIVYGEIIREEKNMGALARYKTSLSGNFNLNVVGGYTHRDITFIDTSSYIYTWFGDVVRDSEGRIIKSTPGELGPATNLLTTGQSLYGRLNLIYNAAPRHEIQFSSAPTHVSRNIEERYRQKGQTTFTPEEVRKIFSWVNGISYNWHSQNEKFENSLFGKHYLNHVEAREKTNGAPINQNRQSNNFGFGDNLRYKLNEQWLFKISYEWATRLPRPEEIFGDGSLIKANLDLKPERSHNANLEINYTNPETAAANWNISLNGFLRNIDQLILLLGNNEVFSYQNVFSARSVGIEASAYWESPQKRFRIALNTTWLDFRNLSSSGAFGKYEGDRIPNRPYFFANANLHYRIPEPFGRNDEIQIFLNNSYIHGFYRGWESVGLEKFKDVIPSQFVQNLGLTYKIPVFSLDTSFTIEAQNVTDAKVFDFFGAQKPGRAFYFKLTTNF